jgi:hypothetical protein
MLVKVTAYVCKSDHSNFTYAYFFAGNFAKISSSIQSTETESVEKVSELFYLKRQTLEMI